MSNKFVTELGLKTVLEKFKSWFPFTVKDRTDHKEMIVGENSEDNSDSVFSVGIGTDLKPKSAIDIRESGDIYIYDSKGSKVKLQNVIQQEGGGVNVTMDGYDSLEIPNEEEGQPTDNDTYKILEDDTVQMAIKKLDKRQENTIVEKSSYLEFPTIGKMNVTYLESSTGHKYIWDTNKMGYIKITSDVIYGGGAADWK